MLKVNVDVTIENRVVPTTFTVLPHLKNNRTLLGVDFSEKAKIVLNVPENCWYFCDSPTERHLFFNETDIPNRLDVLQVNEWSLRPDEAELLDAEQTSLFNKMLEEYSDIFEPGGGPTGFAVHKINTTDHEPIAVPPYPVSGPRKEFLKEEIDRLVTSEIIEECESPWASPLVLVPKKDGKLRLCVDYRRLNEVTVTDTYPMPKIDDLLHTAKRTHFMSTIDLQSGFWQVPVAPEDKDKTCFVSLFGTYQFN